MRFIAVLAWLVLGIWGCQPTTDDSEKAVQENWTRVELPSHGTSLWVNQGDIRLFEVVMADGISHSLIGGTVPQASDWPASFASRQSGSGCTATLIGESVLQLAAHCVGNGRTAQITADGVQYTGTCTHAPGYARDSTADWALCKMSAPVPRAFYEKVLQDASKIKVGTVIKLAGAGCTQPGGNDGSFGTFRIGDATVSQIPASDNDTVAKGGAALCFGDSGGSAFYIEAPQRWVMGVNSRGDIRTTSYLSSVFTQEAKTFYSSWATQQGVKICGIHSDAVKCQGDNGPPVPPLPAHCQPSFDKVNQCIFGSPRLALTDVPGCRKAYADLFACEEAAEIAQ